LRERKQENKMDLADLIGPEDVEVGFRATCKKQVLEDMAEAASRKTGIDSQEIFDTLVEREKLGSTGVGNGIAIPHGKLASLESLVALVAILDKPVDFDSVDDQPVDIVFMLLAPENAGADHLKALARVARVLREPDTLVKMREASEKSTVYELVTQTRTPFAA
jgi:PTS system nitrogen regulatory IIA component